MTACNMRPPEGHPWHGSLVACHLRAGHAEPHSWDISPKVMAEGSLRAEMTANAVIYGTADLLIGICADLDCGYWFPVDEIGEACPNDKTEDRSHPVNYYMLCGVKR